MESIAYTSMIGILITIICIGIAWWSIQIFRFDMFTHNPKSAQAKALQIIISVVLGYQLANFLIDYVGWSVNLKYLFQS